MCGGACGGVWCGACCGAGGGACGGVCSGTCSCACGGVCSCACGGECGGVGWWCRLVESHMIIVTYVYIINDLRSYSDDVRALARVCV